MQQVARAHIPSLPWFIHSPAWTVTPKFSVATASSIAAECLVIGCPVSNLRVVAKRTFDLTNFLTIACSNCCTIDNHKLNVGATAPPA